MTTVHSESAPASAASAGAGAREPEQRPFFIVGSERSGTTMLRLMLSHHPRLAVCSEFEYVVAQLGPRGERPETALYRKALARNRMFRSQGFEVAAGLDYDDLVRSFLRQRRERDGKDLVGGVVHFGFERLPFLWPDAAYIHLLRDGRDVARSCVQMGWAGNVWIGAERWIAAQASWDELCARTRPDQRLEARFEALVREPAEELSRICAFLGVAYDARMLAYHERTTYDPPDPRVVGQWRSKLSDDEVRLLEVRMGELLVRRGYALSGLPPLRVTDAAARRLRRHDRIRRAAFRRRRFGLWLWLADLTLRRLGWRSLHRKVRRRMDRIQDAHAK